MVEPVTPGGAGAIDHQDRLAQIRRGGARDGSCGEIGSAAWAVRRDQGDRLGGIVRKGRAGERQTHCADCYTHKILYEFHEVAPVQGMKLPSGRA